MDGGVGLGVVGGGVDGNKEKYMYHSFFFFFRQTFGRANSHLPEKVGCPCCYSAGSVLSTR